VKYTRIGSGIKALRKNLNKTQLELGFAVGFERSVITQFENDTHPASLRFLIRALSICPDVKTALPFIRALDEKGLSLQSLAAIGRISRLVVEEIGQNDV
jgi:DNA-binding XRE family transcriptional regulator